MPLVTPREHIALSWRHYTQHIGRFLEVSLWLLVPTPLQAVLLFGFTSSLTSASLSTVWKASQVFGFILGGALSLWVQIRLIKLALAQNPKEEGYIATHPHVGWGLFFPVLFGSLLTGLALIGGTTLFVIPGIWLSISLLFVPIIIIDTPKRGTQALEASFALVRGRWWPVLGRMMLAGISIIGIAFFLQLLLRLLMSVVVDSQTAQDVARLTRLLVIDRHLSIETLRAFAITALQDSLLQAIYLPFLTVAQCVLYTSLKQTTKS